MIGIIDGHRISLMAIMFIQKRLKFIERTVTVEYKNTHRVLRKVVSL